MENHKKIIPLNNDNDFSTDEGEFNNAKRANLKDL